MSKRGNKASGFRKPYGAQRLDRMVAPIARPALKKYGFHELHLFEHWADIVGPQLAEDCVPVKVSRAPGRRQGATLVVRVPGHRSLDVQHSSPQILDRLNRFLGGQAISRIKMLQGPVSLEHDPSPRRMRPLKPGDRAQVSQSTKGIRNDALRQAMQRFGERVHRSSDTGRDDR